MQLKSQIINGDQSGPVTLLGLSQSINEKNYGKKRLPQIGISASEEKDL
jgi:hypothetical protein